MIKILLQNILIELMTFVLMGYWTSGLNPFLATIIAISSGAILIVLLFTSIKSIVKAIGTKNKLVRIMLLGMALLTPIILYSCETSQKWQNSFPRRYYMNKK
ncbi:hypothetical protein [Xanthocytophaga agilis]|uniref:Uncharacterized protein n=1 Tax=Xanthocytophaga agilis TaxID=3048010 RepID=A0AAE3RD15_9BACT|nr:hypothetical protein [Xanthocytophaga agilis]MDJ1506074.1 hypothetical protein [Xanthocytophaga agilis]